MHLLEQLHRDRAAISHGSAIAPLAEHWNGSTWAVQPTPNPAGATAAILYGVSCVSAVNCTAVGRYATRSGPGLPFAEHWNGSTWTVETVPLPAKFAAKGATLTSVSCATATQCTAVGMIPLRNPATAFRALAEVAHNGSWRVQHTATPEAGRDLTAVSCVKASPGTCTGIGQMSPPSPVEATLMLAERK